jgi:hypothetical protein
MRSLARPLVRVPDVLRAARVNLREVPRLLAEQAAPRYERLLRLCREDLPRIATGCRDGATQANLAEADTTAVRAVVEFLGYLREDLLPRAAAPAPLGAGATSVLLQSEALEPTSPDSLIARGRRELEWIRARLDSLAARPAGTTEPPADSLTGLFQRALDEIRGAMDRHTAVTLPEEGRLDVRQGPPDRSDQPLVRLDAPGTWERGSTDAWLVVTPSDPHGDRDWLGGRIAPPARPRAAVLAMREGLPGRYLQAMIWRSLPSRLRRLTAPATTTEGWARYAVQMMIEQDSDGNPRLESAWLEEAQQEVAACVACLSFHTEHMTLGEAEAFLARAGTIPPAEAARAARRAAAGLDAVAPVLGRWQILDARRRVQARLGVHFDLRAFHDALLAQGAVPIPLAAAAVLEASRPPAMGTPPR